VATDAPLLSHQLKRLAKRAALGIGRMGGVGGDSSGDIFIAFSTANAGAAEPDSVVSLRMLPNNRMNGLFEATVDATEEAIVNAMVTAETMTGADGYRVYALPADQVMTLLRRAGRFR
jgi:L-aminopeptidase/D-esterase-like protein